MRVDGAIHYVASEGSSGYEYARLPDGQLAEVQRPWCHQTTEWRVLTHAGDWVPSRRPRESICTRILLGLGDVEGTWTEVPVECPGNLLASEVGDTTPPTPSMDHGCTPGQVQAWVASGSDTPPVATRTSVQYRRQVAGLWYTHTAVWSGPRVIEWAWTAAGWVPRAELYRDPSTGQLARGEIVGQTRPGPGSIIRATRPQPLTRRVEKKAQAWTPTTSI